MQFNIQTRRDIEEVAKFIAQNPAPGGYVVRVHEKKRLLNRDQQKYLFATLRDAAIYFGYASEYEYRQFAEHVLRQCAVVAKEKKKGSRSRRETTSTYTAEKMNLLIAAVESMLAEWGFVQEL